MLVCACRERATYQECEIKERPHLRRWHPVIGSRTPVESRDVRNPVGLVRDCEFRIVEAFHREFQVNPLWWHSDINDSPELVTRVLLSNLDMPTIEGSADDGNFPHYHPEYSSLPR